MTADVIGFSIFGVVLIVFMASTLGAIFGQVHRTRVERFGLRQVLPITVANGPVVIRYLATTRRWRGGLLAITLAALVLQSVLSRRGLNISGAGAFAGWFIGAVVAEWRVSSPERGPRVAASLRPRRVTDYVRLSVLALVALVWLAAAVAVVAALFAAAGSGALVTLGLFVLATVSLQAVTRRVLDRAQPLADPEVTTADNAIRARSLNVLAGCALAIGGYLGASAALVWQHGSDPGSTPSGGVVGVVGYVFLPILGVIVAKGSRPIPVPEPATRPLAA